jgi:hypothetical protein
METLLDSSVMPQITRTFRDVTIGPQLQDIRLFEAAMMWEDLIPMEKFTLVLETEIFTRWLRFLYLWLGSCPNFDEVSNWYAIHFLLSLHLSTLNYSIVYISPTLRFRFY